MSEPSEPRRPTGQVSAPALRERGGVRGWIGRIWHRVKRTPR